MYLYYSVVIGELEKSVETLLIKGQRGFEG
jgi:hypothetical protein